ncbi:VCBS domain-containing protein [uncultured Microbulbifer sp.]|uniref:VCBS domain-containing protein n=1 Tax=uncultured Microbulbifer sp. TaxID=348147 RepID=UPI002603CDC6|nr:VCBS domain-containing protein [uncultured Microbulbifer sp.]
MPGSIKIITAVALATFLTACSGGSSSSGGSDNKQNNNDSSTDTGSGDSSTDTDTGDYSFNPATPLATLVVGNNEYAQGTLQLENTDSKSPSFQAGTFTGEYGDFKLYESGNWEYRLNSNTNTLNNGASVQDTLTFLLSNGDRLSVNFSIQTVVATQNSIVFVLVNFSDTSVTDDVSISDLANMTFNDIDSLDNAYKENSLGQLKFQRHLSNNNTLAQYCYGEENKEESSIDCFVYSIPDSQNGGILSLDSAQARAGNSQDGQYSDGGYTWRDNATAWIESNFVDANNRPVDLGDWRHRVFIFPDAAYRAGLIGSGVAAVNGRWSIITADSDQLILGHELGHNIGLGHAGNDDNNDGDTNDRGENEYGASAVFMGNSWESRLFGSAHRDYMGWYNKFPGYTTTIARSLGNTSEIQVQAIELTAGELNSNLPQLLKVESSGSANGENHYFVEYHIAHNTLNPRPQQANQVTIHYLQDRTANQVATLEEPGSTFTDTSAGITIEFISRDSTNKTATISVNYSN